MKDEKDFNLIDKRTGKPFSEKFIANMKKNAKKFCEPRDKEWSENHSKKMKEIHAKQRTFREVARMILEMSAEPEIVEKIKEHLPGLDKKEITNRVAMMQKLVEKALKGDMNAFQIVRDTAGEKPVEKQEIVGGVSNLTTYNKEDMKKALVDAKKVLNELE